MKTHFAYIAHTKYLPPTNTKGARVSVTCNGKRKVYPFEYGARDVHAWAFEQFRKDTGLQVAECLESELKGGRVFAFRGGCAMNDVNFPSVSDVERALIEVLFLDEETNVRLQVYENGEWALRVGLSDYDQDHRGYWGAESIGAEIINHRDNVRAIAESLLEQAKEQRACGGDV